MSSCLGGIDVTEDEDVRFELHLFKRWQLFLGRTEVNVPFRQQRLIAALALLGAQHRGYVSGLLWPDSPGARALESLRVTVHLISRQTPGLLVNEGPVLSLTNSIGVDLHRCVEQVRNCRHSDSSHGQDACLPHLLGAELLPGWYEDWVILEQHRLRTLRLHALLVHARRWLDSGDAESAAMAARSALEIEPLHESCLWLLMRAELDLGNRACALQAFEAFRTKLAMEMDVAPSDYLVELAIAVRGQASKAE